MTPNQKTIDALIRHRVLALGYARSVVDEVVRFLDATEPDIRRALLEIFSTPGLRVVSRLRRAEDQVVRIRGAAWDKLSDKAIEAMTELSVIEPAVLRKALGVPIQAPPLPVLQRLAQKAYVAGSTLKEWFKSLKGLDLKRIVAQLRIGVLAGESLGDILKRILGKLSPVLSAAKNGIRTAIDTAAGAIGAAARRATMKLNRQGSLWELWVSILDSRTTETCRALDGKQYKVGEGPMPGYHPYCRSERIPLQDDGGEYNLGTFNSWIKTQPSWFQKYTGSEFRALTLAPLSLARLVQLEELT